MDKIVNRFTEIMMNDPELLSASRTFALKACGLDETADVSANEAYWSCVSCYHQAVLYQVGAALTDLS